MDRVTQADIDPMDQECMRGQSFDDNASVFRSPKSPSDTKSYFNVDPQKSSTDFIPFDLGCAARKRFFCTLL
jgi:hypothetical protein